MYVLSTAIWQMLRSSILPWSISNLTLFCSNAMSDGSRLQFRKSSSSYKTELASEYCSDQYICSRMIETKLTIVNVDQIVTQETVYFPKNYVERSIAEVGLDHHFVSLVCTFGAEERVDRSQNRVWIASSSLSEVNCMQIIFFVDFLFNQEEQEYFACF